MKRSAAFDSRLLVLVTLGLVAFGLVLILAFSAGPHLLTKLRLDSLLYGREERLAGHYRRHVAACMAFNGGLLTGRFRYLYISAQKPGYW